MSARAGTPRSPLTTLPSDEWQLVPLHWHAYTRPAPADRPPEAALHDPFAVATWLAERTEAHLWQQHLLIASRGTRSSTTNCACTRCSTRNARSGVYASTSGQGGGREMDHLARPDVFYRHAHRLPEDARRTAFRSGYITFSLCSKVCWADDEAAPDLPLCPDCFPGRTDKWR